MHVCGGTHMHVNRGGRDDRCTLTPTDLETNKSRLTDLENDMG